MTTREFFNALEGTEYPTFQELQAKVLEAFNRHLESFPRQYSYLQLIDWGQRNNWIVRDDDQMYRISVQEGAGSRSAGAIAPRT